MKYKIIIALAVFLHFSCEKKDSSYQLLIDDLPIEQIDFQKMVIAQLTGEKSIKTEGGEKVTINSRWDIAEKKLTLQYLGSLLESIGLQPKIHNYKIPNSNGAVDLLIEPLTGQNLYVSIPATSERDEFVILGAHYDTGAKNVPGAIDNGSGMALILSLSRRLKQLKKRGINIMIVFFDQEEEDISAGSLAFARYLKSNNFNVHSVHTFDLIGWDSDNNKEIELELPSPKIEKLYKSHAQRLNIPVYVTKVNSSDHYSFIKEGFEAVGVSQAYAKRDNSGKKDTPDDKYQLVNFEYLSSSTDLVFEVIKEEIND